MEIDSKNILDKELKVFDNTIADCIKKLEELRDASAFITAKLLSTLEKKKKTLRNIIFTETET